MPEFISSSKTKNTPVSFINKGKGLKNKIVEKNLHYSLFPFKQCRIKISKAQFQRAVQAAFNSSYGKNIKIYTISERRRKFIV